MNKHVKSFEPFYAVVAQIELLQVDHRVHNDGLADAVACEIQRNQLRRNNVREYVDDIVSEVHRLS